MTYITYAQLISVYDTFRTRNVMCVRIYNTFPYCNHHVMYMNPYGKK